MGRLEVLTPSPRGISLAESFGRHSLGGMGQTIAEIITGGRPRAFFLELPSRARLKADIYVSATDSVFEVKTGGSHIREGQIAHYQRGHFNGGFGVIFVQNPITGEVGPDLRDYLILRKRGVSYTQVWFSGTTRIGFGKAGGPPRAAKKRGHVDFRQGKASEASPFDFITRNKRGLSEIIINLLADSPMSGMEIMDGVERITKGRWRPSAGSTYPLLRELLELGIITRTAEGKRFVLGDQTRTHFQAQRMAPSWPKGIDDMVSQMQGFVSYMEDVKSSDAAGLEPHKSRLREIAKRIGDLVGEEDNPH